MTKDRPSQPLLQPQQPPRQAAVEPLRLLGRTRAIWLISWIRGSIAVAIRPRFRKRYNGARMIDRTYQPSLRGGTQVRIHHNSGRPEEEVYLQCWVVERTTSRGRQIVIRAQTNHSNNQLAEEVYHPSFLAAEITIRDNPTTTETLMRQPSSNPAEE